MQQLLEGAPISTVPEITPQASRSLLAGLNAGAIVVAALYFGQELLVPLVLASLLAFVLAPACARLQRLGLSRVIAVIVVVALAAGALAALGLVGGRQVSMLASNLPSYETTVLEKWHGLETGGGLLQRLAESVNAGTGGGNGLLGGSGLSLAKTVALPLLSPLATAGVVLIFTIFILLASEDLRDRLVRLVGRRDLHRTILAMNDAARRLSRYFLFQLAA